MNPRTDRAELIRQFPSDPQDPGPAFDLDAERRVLASLATSENGDWRPTLAEITVDHFYDQSHRIIFETLREHLERDGKADISAVRHTIERCEKAEKINDNLISILDSLPLYPTGDAGSYWLDRLNEFLQSRELRRLGQALLLPDSRLTVEQKREALQTISELTRGGMTRSRQITTAPRSLWDLIDDPPPLPDSLVGDRLVCKGGTFAIVAPAGKGKSYKALQMAIAVAAGRPWLDFETERAPVLVCDLEMNPGISVERATNLACLLEVNRKTCEPVDFLSFLWTGGSINLGDDGDLEGLRRLIVERNYGLVILDPWAAAFCGDENSGQEVSEAIDKLNRMRAQTGAAFGLVCHSRKKPAGGGPDDALDSLRGSSRLRDFLETIMVVDEYRGKARLRFPKIRNRPPLDPVFLDQADGGGFIPGEPPEDPSDSKTRNIGLVLNIIREGGSAGLSRAAIFDHERAPRVGKTTQTDYLSALILQGKIEISGGGKASIYRPVP